MGQREPCGHGEHLCHQQAQRGERPSDTGRRTGGQRRQQLRETVALDDEAHGRGDERGAVHRTGQDGEVRRRQQTADTTGDDGE
jgi:hypothetical protein